MLVGIIGGPNKGKSTLFSALTMNEVAIADYPFTTIDPNFGLAYATKKCVHAEFGVTCRARNSLCVDGMRMLPINVVDVAGLVEGANAGKGMGNRFLNDLSSSDAFMIVIDASGKTDSNGNPSVDSDITKDVDMVREELVLWLAGILKSNMPKLSKRLDGKEALLEILSSLKVNMAQIEQSLARSQLASMKIRWSDQETHNFASALIDISKPSLIVANKMDAPGAPANFDLLKKKFGDGSTWCMAAMELALRKAAKSGIIKYLPGDKDFSIAKTDISREQAAALQYMKKTISGRGTNVQEVINKVAFGLLENIVVYPVEDENKLSDHSGNVLPDAILVRNGSTAQDLAYRIHTEIGKSMLYAIDARAKMRIGKDHVLKDNDVIKIVSATK